MGRTIKRLSPRRVATETKRGLHADGGGLNLQISNYDTKAWIFRFTLNGRARQMGLGAIHTVSLAEARDEAEQCRKQLRNGVDPIEARKFELSRRAIASAKSITFRECALAYINAHKSAWRNAKHELQWSRTLETYVYPTFGDLPVSDIDIGLVIKVLEPIWSTKTETASRTRGRIESILDWATVREYREGENPARWKGTLEKLLPSRAKVRKVKHHSALLYDEIGAFMAELRKRDAISARGLEFLILTATRTGEVMGAEWREINLAERVWVIPAERMKANKEHRTPLSDDAVAVLERMQKAKVSSYVFPGGATGHPLSNMAFLQLLKRMGRSGITVHGFRSSFRDWAAERTNYAGEVAEMALAHSVGNRVEAAYRRGDLFEKRRRLMDDWAKFCGSESQIRGINPINIVNLRPS